MRIYQYKVSIGDWVKMVSFSKCADRDEIIKKIIGLYPGMAVNDPKEYIIELWSKGMKLLLWQGKENETKRDIGKFMLSRYPKS